MQNYIITIARGYGSGGRQIGLRLSEELGIPLLDREIVRMASEESGVGEGMFGHEHGDLSLRQKLALIISPNRERVGDPLTPEHTKFVSNDNLFNIQANILKLLAETESAIIIGKAAHHILRNYQNVVSVNIQAPFEDCVAAIMDRAKLNTRDAIKTVREMDKYREEYNRYYTGQDWLLVDSFDMTLNSSRIGREKCVDLIRNYTKIKLGIDI